MRIKTLLQGLSLCGLLLASSSTLALSATPTADEIMAQVNAQPTPESSSRDMQMILIDRKGKQRVREIRSFTLEQDEVTKSAMYFLSPSDVRNTGFLTYDYDAADADDDQWLFLPSLKKSKRIAAGDKSGSFMGSDFSYADMGSRELSEWNFTLLKEDVVKDKSGEHKVWIIDSRPASKAIEDEYGYVRSVVYVRQDNFMVLRALNQTPKGQVKLLSVTDMAQIDGYWQIKEMIMQTREGKQIKHRTVLRFTNHDMQAELPEDYFTLRQLEKGLR